MIEFIRMGAESSAAIQVDRAKIVYRRLGNGRPLLVLNGFGAASSDWDPGGSEADLASAGVWSQLVDTSGAPHDQAKRLLSLLFPDDVAESFYRKFGDIVAAARARLSPDLINRQAAAMDAWHRNGAGDRVRGINAPVLIATGSEDVVIPPSNALKLLNAIHNAWLAQFPHGGHAFRAQYPRQLRDLLNYFLAIHAAMLQLRRRRDHRSRLRLSASMLSSVYV